MSDNVIAAAAQINPLLGNRDSNLAKIDEYARLAADRGAQLVIFPEAAVTGYCFDSREEAMQLAEPIPGPASQAVATVCGELGLHAVFGMLERDGELLYNAAVLTGPQGTIATYRKVHLPYLGVDRFADPGPGPFTAHSTPVGTVGMHICYDANFPESARAMALGGADVLALPTNWPEGREKIPRYIVHARAMENRAYVVACNRVGVERGFTFIGQSKIVSPTGDALAEAGSGDEELILATLDLDMARAKRVVFQPGAFEIDLFGDRRPGLYGAIVAGGEGGDIQRDQPPTRSPIPRSASR